MTLRWSGPLPDYSQYVKHITFVSNKLLALILLKKWVQAAAQNLFLGKTNNNGTNQVNHQHVHCEKVEFIYYNDTDRNSIFLLYKLEIR